MHIKIEGSMGNKNPPENIVARSKAEDDAFRERRAVFSETRPSQNGDVFRMGNDA